MPFDPDAEAIFAAFTTPAGNARKIAINDFVVALKAADVWAKLDVLYVFAEHAEQPARVNWISPGAFTATAVAAPAFAKDEGFDFNGTTQYLDTNWVPSVDAVNYAQDDASVFVWCTESESSATIRVGVFSGGTAIDVRPGNHGGAYEIGLNGVGFGNATFGASGDSSGLTHFERSNATEIDIYKNGEFVGTPSHNSTGVPAHSVFVGAANNNGGSPFAFTTQAMAMVGMGRALGPAGAAALYAAALAYLQADKVDPPVFVSGDVTGSGLSRHPPRALSYWWQSYFEQWLDELDSKTARERERQRKEREAAERAQRFEEWRLAQQIKRQEEAHRAAAEAERQRLADGHLRRQLAAIRAEQEAAQAADAERVATALEARDARVQRKREADDEEELRRLRQIARSPHRRFDQRFEAAITAARKQGWRAKLN